jgi:hypothetical protein
LRTLLSARQLWVPRSCRRRHTDFHRGHKWRMGDTGGRGRHSCRCATRHAACSGNVPYDDETSAIDSMASTKRGLDFRVMVLRLVFVDPGNWQVR